MSSIRFMLVDAGVLRGLLYSGDGMAGPIGVAAIALQAYSAAMTSLDHGLRQDSAAREADPDIRGLREFLGEAERVLVLRRVYLFGSRARGDARADSDVDLAFEHRSSPAAWADFVNAAREQAPMLVNLDLVDLTQATPELRERILKEGRLLRG